MSFQFITHFSHYYFKALCQWTFRIENGLCSGCYTVKSPVGKPSRSAASVILRQPPGGATRELLAL